MKENFDRLMATDDAWEQFFGCPPPWAIQKAYDKKLTYEKPTTNQEKRY